MVLLGCPHGICMVPSRAAPMVPPWRLHGILMVPFSVVPVVSRWYCSPVVLPWYPHECVLMAPFHCASVVSPWCPHGDPIVPTLCVQDFSMVTLMVPPWRFRSVPHGVPMVSLWCIHGASITIPWCLHRASAVFPWWVSPCRPRHRWPRSTPLEQCILEETLDSVANRTRCRQPLISVRLMVRYISVECFPTMFVLHPRCEGGRGFRPHLMGTPWCLHGASAVSPWYPNGIYMVPPWRSRGASVVPP